MVYGRGLIQKFRGWWTYSKFKGEVDLFKIHRGWLTYWKFEGVGGLIIIRRGWWTYSKLGWLTYSKFKRVGGLIIIGRGWWTYSKVKGGVDVVDLWIQLIMQTFIGPCYETLLGTNVVPCYEHPRVQRSNRIGTWCGVIRRWNNINGAHYSYGQTSLRHHTDCIVFCTGCLYNTFIYISMSYPLRFWRQHH